MQSLLPGYRNVVEEYIARMTDLGFRILEIIAQSLGFEKSYLHEHFDDPMTFLRPLMYLPVESNEGAGYFACGSHTDYGCITILYAPESGLQVWDSHSGEWIDVEPLGDGFVVNIGMSCVCK